MGQAVTYSLKRQVELAIDIASKQLPSVSFQPTDGFHWQPSTDTLHYLSNCASNSSTVMLLLHEIGHALADHQLFRNDIDLLRKEVEAWQHAEPLAGQIEFEIDESVVENCLDSYRHWLDKRSTCPTCEATGYQDHSNDYRCFNCASRWRVNPDQTTRVCRITVQ